MAESTDLMDWIKTKYSHLNTPSLFISQSASARNDCVIVLLTRVGRFLFEARLELPLFCFVSPDDVVCLVDFTVGAFLGGLVLNLAAILDLRAHPASSLASLRESVLLRYSEAQRCCSSGVSICKLGS